MNNLYDIQKIIEWLIKTKQKFVLQVEQNNLTVLLKKEIKGVSFLASWTPSNEFIRWYEGLAK